MLSLDGNCLKLFSVFFRIGALTFGGGFSMIPLIQREVVDNHHWLSRREFMDAVAVSQTVPGAVSINIAIFVGYKVARYRGAFIAIAGLAIPSFLIIVAVASLLLHFFEIPLIVAFFKGAAGAVVALLVQVTIVFSREIFKQKLSFLLTGIALILCLWLRLHPIFIIITCSSLGFWLGNKKKVNPDSFPVKG